MTLATTAAVTRLVITSAFTPRWHVVRSVTGADKAIRATLERIGMDCYYPVYRTLKAIPRNQLSHKQRRQNISFTRPHDEAMFPTYVFVRFDLRDGRWHEIFRIIGLFGLISAHGLPAQVPDEVIHRLQALEVDGAIPGWTPMIELPFKVGERARIVDGPFTDRVVTIAEIDADQRISVLMDLLGRQTRVLCSVSDLQPATPIATLAATARPA